MSEANLKHLSQTHLAWSALHQDEIFNPFDPFTAAAVASANGGVWEPAAGSIVVRADPSDYVSDSDAAAFQERGVSVRNIPGAAHSVWYSNFDQFIAALPEVFQ